MKKRKKKGKMDGGKWALAWILFLNLPPLHGAPDEQIRRVGESLLLEPRGTLQTSRDDITWIQDNKYIVRNSSLKHPDAEKYHFFPNGTLRIRNGRKEDSGNYSLWVWDHNGTFRKEEMTHVTFLEPLSVPRVWRSCPGGGVIICSVENGERIRFRWTWMSNGNEESAESSAEPGEHAVETKFSKDNVPENLSCEVFNEVSRAKAGAPRCRGHFSSVTAALLLFLVVCMASVLFRHQTINENENLKVEENIYQDMRGKEATAPTPPSPTSDPEDPYVL